MGDPATLLIEARRLSLNAQLVQAQAKAEAAQAAVTHATPLAERFEVMLVSAQIARHRGPGQLHFAVDCARQALRLARLAADRGLMLRAQLELAACQVAAGQTDLGTLHQLALTPEPELSGRAWRLLGAAELTRERVFVAIAWLLNAVAEHHRGGHTNQLFATQTLLLLAFSRAGHLEDADALVARAESLDSVVCSRHWIEFKLAHAEHAHRAGRIDQALELLDSVKRLLGPCSGMDVAWCRHYQLRANCLADWRQEDEAERALSSARCHLPAPQPQGSAVPRSRSTGRAQRLGSYRQPRRREAEAAPIEPRELEQAIADLAQLPPPGPEPAKALAGQLDRLAGRPGLERQEAILLTKAGTQLGRSSDEDCLLVAERLLRRAVARLEFLEGTKTWLAQARVSLGILLSASEAPNRRQEALELLLAGLKGLDNERFLMLKRPYRTRWLQTSQHQAIARAIELAVACEDIPLAADLITFSRLAGVPNPKLRPGLARDELPLTEIPTLIYIDGKTSGLGSQQQYRLL